jgi:hypothetical protein
MAPMVGASSPLMAPTMSDIDIFNPPVQNFFFGGSAMSGGGFSDAEIGSQIDDSNEQSFVGDDPVAGFDFTPGPGVGGGSFDVVSAPTITGDEQQQNFLDSEIFVGTPSLPTGRNFGASPNINLSGDVLADIQKNINIDNLNELSMDDSLFKNNVLTPAGQAELNKMNAETLQLVTSGEIPASNFISAGSASDILGTKDTDLGVNLARSATDTGLRGSLTPGTSQDVIDTAKNAIRASAGNNLAIDNLVAQFGRLDPSIGELADRTKRGIGQIGQIKPGDLDDLSGTPTITRDVQGPIQARTIFDLDTTGTREFRIPDSQSELDQAPSAAKIGFASSKIPGQFDETASGEAFAGGDIPLSVAPFTTATGATADDTDPREDTLGVLPAQTLADIERLSNVPVGQRKAGPGSDPTFFQGLGLPSFFDGIERFSRDRMAAKLARGDVPEDRIVRNDSGRVVALKDQFGRTVEGVDPNEQIFGSDDNQEPIIKRPIPPKEEEKKDDDRPPNIIGGTDSIVTLPVEPTTVVASPFAPATSKIDPVTFDSGQLNKLIELLTGVPAKPIVSAQEGGLIRAVDDFLATGT